MKATKFQWGWKGKSVADELMNRHRMAWLMKSWRKSKDFVVKRMGPGTYSVKSVRYDTEAEIVIIHH